MSITKTVEVTLKITNVSICTDGENAGCAEISYRTTHDGVVVGNSARSFPSEQVMALLMQNADAKKTVYQNVSDVAYSLIE